MFFNYSNWNGRYLVTPSVTKTFQSSLLIPISLRPMVSKAKSFNGVTNDINLELRNSDREYVLRT